LSEDFGFLWEALGLSFCFPFLLAPTAAYQPWQSVQVLGLVGLIELRPQLLVSIGESPWNSRPFSAPFRIQNAGYLSVPLTHVYCYAHELEINGNRFHGGMVVHSNDWDDKVLDGGESVTEPCPCMLTTIPPTKADIAVVVDATVHGKATSRRYFHFVGVCVQNRIWTEQPSEEIREAADKAFAKQFQANQGSQQRRPVAYSIMQETTNVCRLC